MQILTNEYHTRIDGVHEITFPIERIAREELREQLEAAALLFVKNKLPGVTIIKAREYNPERHTLVEHTVVGRDGRRKVYEHIPRKIKVEDILAIKLHGRGRYHREFEKSGKKAQARIRITLVDSTQLEAPWPIKKRGGGKPAKDAGETGK